MTSVDSLRAAAADEAAATGSGFVGSEHLFLAWLGVGSGPAHDAVAGAGLTAESFRAMLGNRREALEAGRRRAAMADFRRMPSAC